jgi:hypothetical protein
VSIVECAEQPALEQRRDAMHRWEQRVSGVGVARVRARIRAGTHAGTCSRGAAWDRSNRPGTPSCLYRSTHLSTVGNDTPANAAVSTRAGPHPSTNTILAWVATAAETSREFTSARRSTPSASTSSMPIQRQIRHQRNRGHATLGLRPGTRGHHDPQDVDVLELVGTITRVAVADARKFLMRCRIGPRRSWITRRVSAGATPAKEDK